MASIFSRIVKGEIPSYRVAETDHYLAFLDVRPQVKGHTLVIPKAEVDYIFDLDEEQYTGLMQFAKRVAAAVERAIPCKRIGMAVVGLEVPHTHVHLIPLQSMDDMRFSNNLQFSDEEMAEIAARIRAAYK